MNLIPSFQVDHTKIVPGIYESRVDETGEDFVTTFDVRMKRPNTQTAISPDAMHTIEHIIATYLRNDNEWKDRIVYWGPMGCLTGCYLIVKGRPQPKELAPLLIRAFRFCENYEGVVPGATAENCGNYKLHNLDLAKKEAKLFADLLQNNPSFTYPVTKRIITENGEEFYDS